MTPLQLRCITNKGGKRNYLRVPIAVELANLSKRMAAENSQHLTPAEIEAVFDLNRYFRHVEEIFARVFGRSQ